MGNSLKTKSILFLGSMNAMPMMYALELRKRKLNVQYLVDAPKSDALSRPESHFSEISYPYPDWIKEVRVRSLLLVSIMPKLFYKLLENKFNFNELTHVFLSGYYIAMAPYFRNKGIAVQHLTYGADLDFFCNRNKLCDLQVEFYDKSFTKYLPKFIANEMIKKSVENHIYGAQCSQNLICFPKGFSESGDQVIAYLEKKGVTYLPRLDVSLDIFKGHDYEFNCNDSGLTVLCAARFHYFNRVGENKGNDVIIKGISNFVKDYPGAIARVIFFNKGPDLQMAKDLCITLGISKYVDWLDPVPMTDLIKIFKKSDVCFDQVGDHWVSAVGIYALLMGKPTIANSEKLRFIFPTDPILDAKTPEQIAAHLKDLIDEKYRKAVSLASREFAVKSFLPNKIIDSIFNPLNDK